MVRSGTYLKAQLGMGQVVGKVHYLEAGEFMVICFFEASNGGTDSRVSLLARQSFL